MATIDLWIACGQSNMEGQGMSSQAPSLDAALCWEFNYEANSIIALSEPGPNNVHNANTGSCLPALAKAFTTRSARPALFIRAAKGGSALLAAHASFNGDWSPTGSCFPNAITRTQAAITKATGAGHAIGTINVAWHQGEQDSKQVDDGSYYTAYCDLVSRFRTALASSSSAASSLRIFAARIGIPGALGSSQADGWASIRDAQVKACADTDGLDMAYLDCADFFNRHWMKSDGMHYTQNGYNDMGHKMGDYAADQYVFAEAPPETDPGVPHSPTSHGGLLLRVADRVLGTPTWTTPGDYSYIVPSGVTSIPKIEVHGTGGGGGFSPSLNNKSGGGGGGAGRAYSTGVSVTPGETLTIRITAGGPGGIRASRPGQSGGETGVFRGVTPLVRVAGASGGTEAAVLTTSLGGAGGIATHGDTLTNGSPGVDGTSTLGSGSGGNAASPNGGLGGAGVTATSAGNPGTSPGGGGSGGKNGYGGGAGASGRVIISYT